MSSLDLVPFRVLIDRVTGSVRRHFKTMLLPAAVPLAAVATVLGVLQLRWVGALGNIEEKGLDPAVVAQCTLFGRIGLERCGGSCGRGG